MAILRRPEFKRKRWYKRRYWKRQPIARIFKTVYSDLAASMIPLQTPLLGMLKKHQTEGTGMKWGGRAMYFDVTVGE